MEQINEEPIAARHRKEKKELLARIQQLKHAIPKGDKKKKKEVMAQIAVLESELECRHAQELQLSTGVELAADNIHLLSLSCTNDATTDSTVDCAENETVKKPSKAQRRKVRKSQKAQEREDRIREQDSNIEQSARFIEDEKLQRILFTCGLTIHEIPADGNCLFSAVEDQLKLRRIDHSVASLRCQTAEYMRKHRDDFLPFLVRESTGDLYSEEEFSDYCDLLEKTSEWGGQAEIRALSEVLQLPVQVIQADGPIVTVGDHYSSAEQTLHLVYHRHKYGLGEHYSSVRKIVTFTRD